MVFNKNVLLNNSESSFPVTIQINLINSNPVGSWGPAGPSINLDIDTSSIGFEKWYNLNKQDFEDIGKFATIAAIDYYDTTLNYTTHTSIDTIYIETTSDKIVTIDTTVYRIVDIKNVVYFYNVDINTDSTCNINSYTDEGYSSLPSGPKSFVELSNFTSGFVTLNATISLYENPF